MKYVALLRGIGPGNPNMHNDKLREFFKDLGFSNIQTVIASGNVLFETKSKDTRGLETLIETELPKKLGFNSTTIIRSQEQLQELVDAEPFGNLEHGRQSYLMVTFFKNPTKVSFKLPYQPPGKPYKVVGFMDNTLFTVTDTTVLQTTDLMTWLEKEFGKQISSRTWKTANRILDKLEKSKE